MHGFGFSFALRESLQFAGAHLLSSLLAFNVGVELGQLLVLLLLVPALELLFRRGLPERTGIVVASVFVAHTAWHWLLERGEKLLQYQAPALDAASLVTAMRVALVVLVFVAAAWVARRWWPRRNA